MKLLSLSLMGAMGSQVFLGQSVSCEFSAHNSLVSVQVSHLVQHFGGGVGGGGGSLAARSFLGGLLPESLLYVLTSSGPQAFAAAMVGDSDTPELVWTHRMRAQRLIPQVSCLEHALQHCSCSLGTETSKEHIKCMCNTACVPQPLDASFTAYGLLPCVLLGAARGGIACSRAEKGMGSIEQVLGDN